jgi:hypothetical protein
MTNAGNITSSKVVDPPTGLNNGVNVSLTRASCNGKNIPQRARDAGKRGSQQLALGH